jgi:uncharacterized protein (TIGR03089 family)
VHQLSQSPEALFATIVSTAPSRPFVTFYDDATGERSELSAKSLANWVAKTYFLLTDELGLGPGERALAALPAHWISVPVLLAGWTAGLSLGTGDPEELDAAQVGFVGPDTIGLAEGIPDVFVIAPQAAAKGFGATPPPGTQDFVTAVRPQPDAWASVSPRAGDEVAAVDGLSRRELVEVARDRAQALQLPTGARLLTTRPWLAATDWLDALVLPLVLGGSVVIVANADAASVERRAQQERAVVIN